MVEPRLALVILAVEDRTRSLEFYREAFEWPLVVDTPNYAELVCPGGMRLGIYDRRGFGMNIGVEPRPSLGVTSTELYIFVDDLEVASERAIRSGARLLDRSKPRIWGDTVAYFSDPDGNVIALASASDSSAPT